MNGESKTMIQKKMIENAYKHLASDEYTLAYIKDDGLATIEDLKGVIKNAEDDPLVKKLEKRAIDKMSALEKRIETLNGALEKACEDEDPVQGEIMRRFLLLHFRADVPLEAFDGPVDRIKAYKEKVLALAAEMLEKEGCDLLI